MNDFQLNNLVKLAISSYIEGNLKEHCEQSILKPFGWRYYIYWNMVYRIWIIVWSIIKNFIFIKRFFMMKALIGRFVHKTIATCICIGDRDSIVALNINVCQKFHWRWAFPGSP